MRERIPQPSAHRWAEVFQQRQVKNQEQGRACLRIHRAFDGGTSVPRCRNDPCKSLRGSHKSHVQHRPSRTDFQISPWLDKSLTRMVQDLYSSLGQSLTPPKKNTTNDIKYFDISYQIINFATDKGWQARLNEVLSRCASLQNQIIEPPYINRLPPPKKNNTKKWHKNILPYHTKSLILQLTKADKRGLMRFCLDAPVWKIK